MPLSHGSEKTIKDWFDLHCLELPDDFIERTELYNDLIVSWSEKINIVSRNDLGILLERHILDSLTPVSEIPDSGSLLDIGSGAGFPAIPIAFIRPGLNITALESRQKKTLFLKEAVNRLKLANVTIHTGRLEDYQFGFPVDIATVRAVAITEKILRSLKTVVKPDGKIIYYEKPGRYRLV